MTAINVLLVLASLAGGVVCGRLLQGVRRDRLVVALLVAFALGAAVALWWQ